MLLLIGLTLHCLHLVSKYYGNVLLYRYKYNIKLMNIKLFLINKIAMNTTTSTIKIGIKVIISNKVLFKSRSLPETIITIKSTL